MAAIPVRQCQRMIADLEQQLAQKRREVGQLLAQHEDLRHRGCAAKAAVAQCDAVLRLCSRLAHVPDGAFPPAAAAAAPAAAPPGGRQLPGGPARQLMWQLKEQLEQESSSCSEEAVAAAGGAAGSSEGAGAGPAAAGHGDSEEQQLGWSIDDAAGLAPTLDITEDGLVKVYERHLEKCSRLLVRIRNDAPDAEESKRRLARAWQRHMALDAALLARLLTQEGPSLAVPAGVYLRPLHADADSEGPPGSEAGQPPQPPQPPQPEHWRWVRSQMRLSSEEEGPVAASLKAFKRRADEANRRRERLMSAATGDGASLEWRQAALAEVAGLQAIQVFNHMITDLTVHGSLLTAEQHAAAVVASAPFIPGPADLHGAFVGDGEGEEEEEEGGHKGDGQEEGAPRGSGGGGGGGGGRGRGGGGGSAGSESGRGTRAGGRARRPPEQQHGAGQQQGRRKPQQWGQDPEGGEGQPSGGAAGSG